MMLAIKQIFKELLTEKTRIILTILAIAWGTFAIASMLAVGEGLRLTFAKAVAGAGNNLLEVTGGQTSKNYKGLPANRLIKLTRQDLQAIKLGIPNIISLSPEYNTTKNLQKNGQTLNAMVQAVAADFNKIHEIQIQPGGRFISAIDNHKRNAVIILGSDTIDQLFPDDPNPVGRIIRIGGKPFKVIGAMQKKTQLIASEAPDAYYNWIPAKTYELMANPQNIDTISITYKDINQVENTKNQIQKIIALNHNADPNDDGIINFSDLAKRQETINNFFLGMEIFLGIVGTLTLLVAGVGIANVMLASIKKATHQIGIRMAVGARAYQILLHYIAEALIVTFMGGAAGLGATGLLVYGLRAIPLKGRLVNAIGQPHPTLSITVILIVIVILGLTGLLAGFFPALKATKVDPTEALRYE